MSLSCTRPGMTPARRAPGDRPRPARGSSQPYRGTAGRHQRPASAARRDRDATRSSRPAHRRGRRRVASAGRRRRTRHIARTPRGGQRDATGRQDLPQNFASARMPAESRRASSARPRGAGQHAGEPLHSASWPAGQRQRLPALEQALVEVDPFEILAEPKRRSAWVGCGLRSAHDGSDRSDRAGCGDLARRSAGRARRGKARRR